MFLSSIQAKKYKICGTCFHLFAFFTAVQWCDLVNPYLFFSDIFYLISIKCTFTIYCGLYCDLNINIVYLAPHSFSQTCMFVVLEKVSCKKNNVNVLLMK